MSNILKQLETKEKFERRILKKYEDIIYKTFQVIYEVDGVIEWERIYRFSPTSNFVMIAGTGLITGGQTLASGQELKEDTVIEVSYTVPWKMLDDGSTAYQLADAAKDIFNLRLLMDGSNFHEMLKDEDLTIEKVQSMLPEYSTLEEKSKEKPDVEVPKLELPKHLHGFNLEDLTEKQKESLILNEIGRNK